MKRVVVLFIVTALIVPTIVIYFLSPLQVLEISGVSGNKKELIPVKDKTTFEISFIHSVELSRWVEIYEVNGTTLHLKKTLTKSAGWGLPSTTSSGDFSFEEVNGEGWMAYYLDRDFKSLTISTYSINDYILQIGDTRVALENFGKLVTVKVKTIPRHEYWRWKIGI
jgi:hypothetical protein